MYPDIDREYERYLDNLAEEQYAASLTQKDRDADRYDMWSWILGDEYAEGNKNKKKHLKEAFTNMYGLKPHDVTWDWANEHECPVRVTTRIFDANKVEWKSLENSADMIIIDDIIPNFTATECVNMEKQMFAKKPAPIGVTVTNQMLNDMISYAICPPLAVNKCKSVQKEQEGNNMYEVNLEQNAKEHLRRRAESVRSDKLSELRAKFFINEEHPAKTKDEIAAALKAGEYTFENYYFDKDGRLRSDYNPMGTITLVNPKTDKAGYEVAEKLLGKTYTDLKDAIIVKSTDEGLKALQAFEAQQF